jgi:hypothetical protein
MRGSLDDQEFPCITAFFDESGHSASTKTVSIGGAMTTPKRWGNLRVRWKAALHRHGVQLFHMKDFENRRGEFDGWDETRKRALLTELFDAITDFPLFVIGAVVVVDDFNRLSAEFRQHLIDPWYLCYHSCFHDAITMTVCIDSKQEDIDVEDVRVRACFYELHRQYTWGPVLFEMARQAAKEREWAAPYQNGIIGFGSKRSSVHFQAADLIAYEIRKHVENAIYKQGRPTRWPMKQFLKGFMVVNTFDNANTKIPVESGGFAVFRNAPLTDIAPDQPITFVAQGYPSQKR